jgi:hypothetical protein
MLAVPGKASISQAINDNQATQAAGPGAEHRDSSLCRVTRSRTGCYKVGCTLGDE